MNEWVTIAMILIPFAGILFLLNRMAAKFIKFPKRVFTGLLLGLTFGVILQILFVSESAKFAESMPALKKAIEWINVVGDGYVAVLKMIIMPLIIVSIAGAILNMNRDENLGQTTGQILGVLVGTTAISAIIGILVAILFNLKAPDVVTASMISRGEVLEGMASSTNLTMPQQLLQMLPTNPFYDMAGLKKTSTISVVIFVAFFAMAARQIAKKKEASFNRIKDAVDALHDVVMRMVAMILRLTPYGVAALITKMMATSSWADIKQLLIFILASYVGLAIIFTVHMILLTINGLNPLMYVKKGWPVFLFGFTSRNSAGAMPLNIRAQTQSMGVSEGSANLSASLGASIGQNGCAGLYPAMLAVMIMVSLGMDLSFATLIKLVAVIAVSSFGVAGVGGGATFAALIVLGLMNLPVALVGVLISIEPLIDMGRTAINISGSMTAGVLSSRWQKTLDTSKYNDSSLVISDE